MHQIDWKCGGKCLENLMALLTKIWWWEDAILWPVQHQGEFRAMIIFLVFHFLMINAECWTMVHAETEIWARVTQVGPNSCHAMRMNWWTLRTTNYTILEFTVVESDKSHLYRHPNHPIPFPTPPPLAIWSEESDLSPGSLRLANSCRLTPDNCSFTNLLRHTTVLIS